MRGVLAVALCTAAITVALAVASRADQPDAPFRVEKLLIDGKDATALGGYLDLEAPRDSGATTSIEIFFTLPTAHREANVSSMTIVYLVTGGMNAWAYQPQYVFWNSECTYDATTGRGVFRAMRFPIMRHAYYAFTVDSSNVLAGVAGAATAYRFFIRTYPSIPNVSISSLPAYVIDDQPRDTSLEWPTEVYQEMNRQVPANTSLFFTFCLPPEVWPADVPVAPHLRIFLVPLSARDEKEAFRPVYVPADLPKGNEQILFDGPSSTTLEGFEVAVHDSGDTKIFIAQGPPPPERQSVWIRRPASGRPAYENSGYLKPGAYYSLQFEIARAPYAGRRYEASRFGVKPRGREKPCEIIANYETAPFVKWDGDWFNGHLVPTNNMPSVGWNADFLLRLDARKDHPDLWRTIHFQYLSDDFGAMFNNYVNLYRDGSMRAVTAARREPSGDLTFTVQHILGAQYFHDPDNGADTIASHAVVGDASERIYSPGDPVFIQAAGRLLEGTVKAIRPEKNEVVVETAGEIWPIQGEGQTYTFQAALGPVGGAGTTITLAGGYVGTYLRLRNGRPYANWGILDQTFDFFVDTMDMRVSFERYTPFKFVGDAVTGGPSRLGWRIVSDCEYYMMRHLLQRHKDKPLDTFIHPIYGEGTGWQAGGDRAVALYDYYADGILRAYEEVLGVKGEDYKKVRIGLGGLMFQWGMEYMVRFMLAHGAPAPLEKVFPEECPKTESSKGILSEPLGANPLYYFTTKRSIFAPGDRDRFRLNRWDVNACFLNDAGEAIVGPGDWDEIGKLTPAAVARLSETGARLLLSGGALTSKTLSEQPAAWPHSRWLLENTRFGKGSPFRSVSVEGYGHSSENLAKLILFEKELLARVDRNLRSASPDPYVQNYLQGVYCGTVQCAMFDWNVMGTVPLGKPFQGTGYWPTFFADTMRRVLARAANQPPGIFNCGRFTFDTFLGPDGANGGTVCDTAGFAVKNIPWPAPHPTEWVEVGNGKKIEIDPAGLTVEKDVRKFIRFVGAMTHRLAALAEQRIGEHVISGVASEIWDNPPADVVSGNEPGDEHRFYVLLYDHYSADLESQDRQETPVLLRVRDLPGEARRARVTVWRLDKDHGSLYAITEGKDFAERRGASSVFAPMVLTPDEIAALKKTSGLPLDDRFKRNASRFKVSKGSIDLNLRLGVNSVLFVVLDWGP